MKIGSRLYTMLAVQLVALLAVAAVAVATMHKIGTKLTDIAEEDIPLTEMIQKITVHQLEQAILAEQAIAIGSAKTGKAINSIEDVRTKFDALAKKVDGEILKAEEIAQHGIEHGHSVEVREEFKKVFDKLKQIEVDHKSFDDHVLQMMDKIATDNLDGLIKLEKQIHAEEKALDHAVEALLEEVSGFTAAATRQALADERQGLTLIIIVGATGIIIGMFLSFIISRGITGPVSNITESMQRLSDGELDVATPEAPYRYEVATMRDTLEIFR